MPKRTRRTQQDRKSVSTTLHARRRRQTLTVERLHEAIEVERDNLSKAESVLGCLAIAMEYEMEGAAKPYYPDVARIARDMVNRSINSLDSVALKNLRDKIEEEEDRTFPYSATYLLTFGDPSPGSGALFVNDVAGATSASANI